MIKTIWGTLLTALFFLPIFCSGYKIKVLAAAEDVTIPPSIAENGKSLVYAAVNSETKKPALFISRRQKDGSFSMPTVAFDSTIKAEGIKENFKVFLPLGLS